MERYPQISTIFPCTFNPGMWWKELITWQQKQKPRFAQFSAWLRSWNNLDCKQLTFNEIKFHFFYMEKSWRQSSFSLILFSLSLFIMLDSNEYKKILFALLKPIKSRSLFMNHKLLSIVLSLNQKWIKKWKSFSFIWH